MLLGVMISVPGWCFKSTMLDYDFVWADYEVQVYGANSVFRELFVLIDEAMVIKFPKLKDIKKLKSEESIYCNLGVFRIKPGVLIFEDYDKMGSNILKGNGKYVVGGYVRAR